MTIIDSSSLVSIGMPVYNGDEYIIQALDSLLAQEYKNFELIISDNASIDQTAKICEEYVKRDKRIKYIRQKENIGATDNFKFVLEQATGEYFMFASHDDEWDARFINSMIQVLVDYKNVSVAHCQTIYKLKFDNSNAMLPTFLQGVSLDSPSPRSFKRRLNYAVNENFGELFYGLYRKKCLISDNVEHNKVNFEKGGVIHAGLKAMLNGDAYVSRDFYFIKTVTLDVFLWTYLCAKKKSIIATNMAIEKMLKEFKDSKRGVSNETIINRLRRYRTLAQSILGTSYFHWLYFRSALRTITNLYIFHSVLQQLSLLYYVITYLLKDVFWTVASKIKWGYY